MNGIIVAFQGFVFDGSTVAAFNSHMAWLEAELPDRVQLACGADAGAKECSELVVATVEDWVASR